jgi:hypothetical protein
VLELMTRRGKEEYIVDEKWQDEVLPSWACRRIFVGADDYIGPLFLKSH